MIDTVGVAYDVPGAAVEEEWLTLKEAAAALRVSELTLRRWLQRGLIRGVKLPTARAGWRIPKSEIERLLRLPQPPEEDER